MTDLASGDPITEFVQPLTVTVYYNAGDLDGIDESSLQMLYWDGSAWVSDGITIVERNTVENYVVIQIEHLTEFALFGERKIYLPLVMRSH